MFRQLLTLLVVLFFVQTLVSANQHDQQAIHEEISDDVENFDVAEEDEEEAEEQEDEEEFDDEEFEDEDEEDEEQDEDEDFEDMEENEDEEEESSEDDEENYVDVINRNLASLEELKKALDPLPKKKEELVEGINRNLAKLAATVTASNYPTLNPVPTAPSQSRTPSYQPGATPSNTGTHFIAATPSQTQTPRGPATTPSNTRTRFIVNASPSNTPAAAGSTSGTAAASIAVVSATRTITRSGLSTRSNSKTFISKSPAACTRLSTKHCNDNSACYYSVLFNRCEHKQNVAGSSRSRSRGIITTSRSRTRSRGQSSVTRTRSHSRGQSSVTRTISRSNVVTRSGTRTNGISGSRSTSPNAFVPSRTRSRSRIANAKGGCFALKTLAACNKASSCVWVTSKSKCVHT